MTRKVTIEWLIETLDEHGNIVDVNHSETFPGLPKQWQDVGLVRDVITSKGVEERSWAYINDGKLETFFKYADGSHGAVVPKHYHNEVKL